MATVQSIIDSARYDLVDYADGVGVGIEFDDVELLNYLNRMVGIMDSTLASLNSDLVHETEEDIDNVADQDYIDLVEMNNGDWDSIRSIWIGDNRLTKIPLDQIYYKRKFLSDSAEPKYFALEGTVVQYECPAESADTDVVIHYNRKHRPLVLSQSTTFTAVASTDICTLGATLNWNKIDGPVTVSNSGGALPTGLSTSTNYWVIRIDDTTFYFATSRGAAMAGTDLDLTTNGTGTQTVSQTDIMPYNSIFDEFLREMLVMHAKAKKEGGIEKPELLYMSIFRGRAMQEEIRRGFNPTPYYIDF
jgi:hypothetical protein